MYWARIDAREAAKWDRRTGARNSLPCRRAAAAYGGSGVGALVGTGFGVTVGVGVAGGYDDMQSAVPESVKVCPAIGMNSQS